MAPPKQTSPTPLGKPEAINNGTAETSRKDTNDALKHRTGNTFSRIEWILNKQLNVSLEFQVIELNKKESLQKILWNEVISTPDEGAFDEAWKLFELLYNEKEYVLSYIQRTWLPFKERFVKVWTEKCSHFGNCVSSRAEGAHGKLKKYLQVSTGDLHQVKNKICLAIENEFKEINAQLSMYAMGEILKQYEMVKHATMQLVCTGHFMATMGLPCAHKMIDWKGKALPLDAIHSQWRIDMISLTCSDGGASGEVFKGLIHELDDKYEAWPPTQKERAQERISQLVNPSLPLLFEPNVQCPKGRPSGSKKGMESGSTRRNPSKFEIVDANKRKCSICKGVGHNSRTCPQKFGTNEFNASHIANPNDDGPTMNVIDLHTISTSSNCFWLDD
ncbi:hypothetical protein RHGRI_010537 [Rhododendron griersonianum]|uniref:Protein FAR1-RELATED SEQUENCE n=1 Tax=Rhododendron griersonianum TaxID=479676 RepID=A0AAV6KIX8_9ERIC|nr:hypothetical protein RHGRI_010537 [Rhododendron griersonianum]